MKKIRTDAELKQIAIDLYDGRIFCDRQIKDAEDMGLVFMPIRLGALSNIPKEKLEEIGLIFEYFDKAMPRSVNDMPCFMSFQTLSRSETKTTFGYYNQYKNLKENLITT